MRKVLLPLSIVALTAACGDMHTGGAGQLSDGKPISGTIQVNPSTGAGTVQLLSPAGWSCTSKFEKAAEQTAVRKLPLSCSDGATGNLILTMNQFAQQVPATFMLTNGVSGSVIFGGT